MEKTRKIIAVLLVMAILFSVISVIVSIGVINMQVPNPGTTNNVIVHRIYHEANGEVNLLVEGNPRGLG